MVDFIFRFIVGDIFFYFFFNFVSHRTDRQTDTVTGVYDFLKEKNGMGILTRINRVNINFQQ